MARAATDKAYRNFAAGFITEATGLTFPENSCRDIDNCDLELKGTARRRLGLNEELGGSLIGTGRLTELAGAATAGFYSISAVGQSAQANEHAVTVHPWPAPGGRTDLNFLVVQVGAYLYVLNWDGKPVSDPGQIDPLVSNNRVFNLTLPAFQPGVSSYGYAFKASNLDVARDQLQSASGFQRLWMTGKTVRPFYLEYDVETQGLSLQLVTSSVTDALNGLHLAIRDFQGVESFPVDYNPTPAEYNEAHRYNLENQGWTSTQISSYLVGQGSYPSNAQQWILGKDNEGNFDPGLLVKQDFGNSPAPKGRIILDALFGNRVQGISGGTLDPSFNVPATTGFTTVGFFAGRLWMAGDNNKRRPNGVYFSKTLSKPTDAGTFMQENDPTSEVFPDVVDTDGGVIPLIEASDIQRLIPFGAGMLVFAANGVWFIYGGDGGFTATNFSVEKISSTGMLGASTVVLAERSVVFWADNSVYAVALPESGIVPVVQDIAQTQVFSYYSRIDPQARRRAHGTYDFISKKVFWSWLEADEYNYPAYQNAYNRCLILDTRTGAYTKYSFAEPGEELFMNGPMFPKRTVTRPLALEDVFDSSGELVVDSLGDAVVVFVEAETDQDFINNVKCVHLDGINEAVRLTEFYDTNFRDWRTMTEEPFDYESYLVTGDEILEDLQRNKQITYLHSFFQRTETGFVGSEQGLVPRNPSGCNVVARWDWHNTAAGGRWSDPQRAYRYRRPYSPTGPEDTFDTGEEIVYTKLRIRGRGRAVTVRYSSESQRDFQLLGLSVSFTANGI